MVITLSLAACNLDEPTKAEVLKDGDFITQTLILPFHDHATEVTYQVVDGLAIFEGDIVLGKAAQLNEGIESQGVARGGSRYRWPGGVIPYIISGSWGDHDIAMRSKINYAIEEWNSKTNVRLIQRTSISQTDYVNFVSGTGCSSPVGRQGGAQAITLEADCSSGTIIHEIGHAVGLYHEQSRKDRDTYVTVNTQNIVVGKGYNFQTVGLLQWPLRLRFDYALSQRCFCH